MKSKNWTRILFAYYVLVLVWVLLFKGQFAVHELVQPRRLNLIPLSGSAIINGRMDTGEIIGNIIMFIPFGIYLCMLKPQWPFVAKAGVAMGASFGIEALQFIFAIGAADITDLIGNTLGGVLGIGLYTLIFKLFANKEKLNAVVNTLALIASTMLTALIILLYVANA